MFQSTKRHLVITLINKKINVSMFCLGFLSFCVFPSIIYLQCVKRWDNTFLLLTKCKLQLNCTFLLSVTAEVVWPCSTCLCIKAVHVLRDCWVLFFSENSIRVWIIKWVCERHKNVSGFLITHLGKKKKEERVVR